MGTMRVRRARRALMGCAVAALAAVPTAGAAPFVESLLYQFGQGVTGATQVDTGHQVFCQAILVSADTTIISERYLVRSSGTDFLEVASGAPGSGYAVPTTFPQGTEIRCELTVADLTLQQATGLSPAALIRFTAPPPPDPGPTPTPTPTPTPGPTPGPDPTPAPVQPEDTTESARVLRAQLPPSAEGWTITRLRAWVRAKFRGNVILDEEPRRLAQIPCDIFGRRAGSACRTAAIDHGQVYLTRPKPGTTITARIGGAKPDKPIVVATWYDSGLDAPPKPETGRRGCPLGNNYSDADGRDFLLSLINLTEQEALERAARNLCNVRVARTVTGGATITAPTVTRADAGPVDGERGALLTVLKPANAPFQISYHHQRLIGADVIRGADLSRGPINPGPGLDGALTTTNGRQSNEVCFTVTEAATGRAVPGVTVGLFDPSGAQTTGPSGQDEFRITGNDGVACRTWRVTESGQYTWRFLYEGVGGEVLEQSLPMRALERRAGFTTISGREMVEMGDTWVQVGWKAQNEFVAKASRGYTAASFGEHQAGGLNGLAQTFRALLTQVGRFLGITPEQRDGALARTAPEVLLGQTGRETGITPVVLAGTGPNGAVPGFGAAAYNRASPTAVVRDSTASLIANDGASILSNKGGGVVALPAAALQIPEGGRLALLRNGLIANDGASIVSNNSGALIANDGASAVGVGAEGNALIANDGASLIANDGASLIANDGASFQPKEVGARSHQAPALAPFARVAPKKGRIIEIAGRPVIANADGRLPEGLVISGARNTTPVTVRVEDAGRFTRR